MLIKKMIFEFLSISISFCHCFYPILF